MTFIDRSTLNHDQTQGVYRRLIVRRARQIDLPVYFFMDVSNILIGAQQFLVQQGLAPASERKLQRIHLGHLVSLARGPRRWQDGFACSGGNRPVPQVAPLYEHAGIRFAYRENVVSGSEQSVDLAIRHEMTNLALNTHLGHTEPGVVVLATGDGNRSEGESFVDCLGKLRLIGHQVELMSWRGCLNKSLQEWVESQDGETIVLDHFWDAITFTPHGRRAKSLPTWMSGPTSNAA
jgi:hypothetical protein